MNKVEYYSIQEFAALKGISRQAVYMLINSKHIDSVKKYGKQLIVNNSKALAYTKQPGRRTDL